jgi:hypothetical protein
MRAENVEVLKLLKRFEILGKLVWEDELRERDACS